MIEEFVCQLKLYEAMGCEVSTTSAMYRQYRLQKVAMKYPELEDLQKVFADDPTSIPQGKHNEPIYRCRKC
ncbi:hypothetical protein NDU88_006512, partial [Pleurodeles waltl]